jgi:hypothetical protein
LIRCEWLRNVVDCAALDGIDRTFDGRECGDDDDADVWLTREQIGEQIQSRIGTQPQVKEDDIEVPAVERLEGCTAGGDAKDAGTRSLQTQPQ